MKIGIIADLHARHKDFKDSQKELETAFRIGTERGVTVWLFAGDIFDVQNIIPDSRKTQVTVGDVVDSVKVPILSLKGLPVYIITGNHDKDNDSSGDALTVLDGIEGVTVIRTPQWITLPSSWDPDYEVQIFCLPWLWEGNPQRSIMENSRPNTGKLTRTGLLAHFQVKGAKLDNGYEHQDGVYCISQDFLREETTFDRFLLGDFHGRQEIDKGRGGYVGAPRQLGFGQAGHETGFEIWDTQANTAEFIELNHCVRHEILEWRRGEAKPTPTVGMKSKVRAIEWEPSPSESEFAEGVDFTYQVRSVREASRLSGSEILKHANDPEAMLKIWAKAKGITLPEGIMEALKPLLNK